MVLRPSRTTIQVKPRVQRRRLILTVGAAEITLFLLMKIVHRMAIISRRMDLRLKVFVPVGRVLQQASRTFLYLNSCKRP